MPETVPREADVVIVGAGPAGCAAGLAIGGRGRVVLVEREREPKPRIGESLVPAARRLLRDLEALEPLERDEHLPYYGNRSYWGGSSVEETDFLRDPDGPGWHLDRTRFERTLRRCVVQNGARLLAPARLLDVERGSGVWRLRLKTARGTRELAARFLVDATGRSAFVATRVGARRVDADALVATWLYGTVKAERNHTAGFSTVESTRDGWWYSAPLPGDAASPARVLAFHTDADLLTREHRSADGLLTAVRDAPDLRRLLDEVGFHAAGTSHTTAAHSSSSERPAGDGWLAIGDAALSLDPLASRGIFNALYTGLKGGQACAAQLAGTRGEFESYAADVERIRTAYVRQLAYVYRAETRWSDSPFWRRRATSAARR